MNNKPILLSPISRLTICFSAGIFFSDMVIRNRDFIMPHVILLIILAIITILLYIIKKNSLFGLLAMLFSFVSGSMLTNMKWIETEYEWHKGACVYVGGIKGEVVDKGKYIQFIVNVDGNKVLTRVMKDSIVQSFSAGDVVSIYGNIKRPANMGNPFEIDYASYLLHNGINGTLFLQEDEIKVIRHNVDNTLVGKALDLRYKVISLFQRWGIAGDELALLSALIVGERNLFSQEIEDSYTKSGLSHILSISGMHVGVLLLIINVLLWFMGKSVTMRIVRWIILAIVLWIFAFLSGLAPSAVRAVIMCLFLELMYFNRDKRNPLNIIFVTALCMLVYNPFYLFDIGFQLSFAAVITIIIFYSPIMDYLRCRYSVINSLSSVVALSISAQIGAAPLILYYFSNFSLYFLLSNLLSSFLIVAIMSIALIAFLLPFSFLHSVLLFLLKLQNDISSMVASLPMSVIKYHNFPFANIIFIYLISLLFLWYMFNKRRKYLIALSVTILSFVSFILVNDLPKEVAPHALIYNDSKGAYIHFVENRKESYVVAAFDDTLNIHPRPAVEKYCNKNGMTLPKFVCDYNCSTLYSQNGIVLWRGKRFCVLCDKRWRKKYNLKEPLEIDYLYINRGFYDSLSSLKDLFTVKNVIIGTSLNDAFAEEIKRECKEQGIGLVNLRERGYYKIMI